MVALNTDNQRLRLGHLDLTESSAMTLRVLTAYLPQLQGLPGIPTERTNRRIDSQQDISCQLTETGQEILSGQAAGRLDKKRRFVLPKSARKMFGETCALIMSPEGCGWVVPVEVLEEIGKALDPNPFLNTNLRISRLIFHRSAYGKISEQGRVKIPDYFLRSVGYDPSQVRERGADLTLVGSGNFIELWEPERLRTKRQ